MAVTMMMAADAMLTVAREVTVTAAGPAVRIVETMMAHGAGVSVAMVLRPISHSFDSSTILLNHSLIFFRAVCRSFWELNAELFRWVVFFVCVHHCIIL